MRAGPFVSVAAAVALTGCVGTPAKGTAQPGAGRPSAPRPAPTACAAQATAAPLPAGFPKDFPLPPGAVVTGSEKRSGSLLIVTATSPQDFRTVLAFFNAALPKAGLKPSGGEVEEDDAESNFAGPAYRGRWTLRALPQCGGNTLVTVLVAPR